MCRNIGPHRCGEDTSQFWHYPMGAGPVGARHLRVKYGCITGEIGWCQSVPRNGAGPTVEPQRLFLLCEWSWQWSRTGLLATFMVGCLGTLRSASTETQFNQRSRVFGEPNIITVSRSKVPVFVDEMSEESSCPSTPLERFREFFRCGEIKWSH